MAEEVYNKDKKSSKASKGRGLLSWLIKHSKKIIVGVVVFALVVSLGLAGLAWYVGSGDVVATIGDKKVTRTEYDDAKVKCDGFYKYNNDGEGQKKCSETEIEDQIFRKALEVEAEKRNITVTDSEINERYQKFSKEYGSEDVYKQTIKNAYGWTPEYVKENFKRDILQEKLRPYLLNERTVSEIFVRYDWSKSAEPSQRSADEKLSREKMEKVLYPLLKNKDKISKEQTIETIGNLRKEGWPWDQEWVVGGGLEEHLNQETAKDKYEGKEDWEAIAKLNKVGEDTGIIKSSGGYFTAYRLEKITQGQFSSWDDFKKASVKASRIRSVSYKYQTVKKLIFQNINDTLRKTANTLNLNKPVYAQCQNCVGGHFSAFVGYLADGSNGNLRINQQNVIVASENDSVAGTKGYCCGEQTSLNVSSGNGNGGFKIGNENDANFKALSCMVRWDVNINATGYYPVSYGNRSVYKNGAARYLDKQLNGTSEEWPYGQITGETYTGPEGIYRTANTDNEAHIWLKPVLPPTGALYSASCDVNGNITVEGWTCDPDDYTKYNRVRFHQYDVNNFVFPDDDYKANPQNIIGPLVTANRWDIDAGTLCGNNHAESDYHGFSSTFAAPSAWVGDGNVHYIYAVGLDDFPWTLTGNLNQFLRHVNLTQSPIGVTCPGTPLTTDTCPTLEATPSSVKQGDPVKLTWSGGNNVQSFDIKQQPSGGTLATLYPNAQSVTGGSINGSIDIVPSITTTYFLDVIFNGGGTDSRCSASSVETNETKKTITVRPSQTGSDRPVPPN